MLACVVMLAAAGSRSGRAQLLGSADPLFSGDVATAEPGSLQTSGYVARSRIARVASSRLGQDTLHLNLFGDVTLDAHVRPTSPNERDTGVWIGQIDGEPLSAVTFVHADGMVQGSIRSARGAFSIEPIGSGPDHVIRQVDLRYAPPELPPLVPPAQTTAVAPPIPPLPDSTPAVFDVLALYTAGARAQAGGSDAAVKARIALGIAEANVAFANSGIPHRLRLVGAELAGYVESGDLAVDLDHLTLNRDGLMDIVHARREAAGADLVNMVVGTAAGGACGVAWVMQTLSVDFAPYAFSVTAYPCISPNYTLVHEIAHNLGSAHAPEDPNAPPVFPYSFGYKDPAQRFRTVMAYDCPSGCPRVLHFSSPEVSYAGQPTGTPERHDNALSITQTGPTVANFRPTRPDDEQLGPPWALGLEAHGQDVTLTWERPMRGEPSGYLVEVGTAEGFANVATVAVNGGLTTSLFQPDVRPGTYFIRVRAVDGAGPGEPSSSVRLVMTTAGRCDLPAGSPHLFTPRVEKGIVSLEWQAPTTGGPAARYVAMVGTRPQSADVGVFDTGSSTAASTPAKPGVYFIRVAAGNGCGLGTPSNEVGVVVGPPVPGPPAGVGATVEVDRRVIVSWRPSSAGGAPTHYVVEAGSAPGLANLAVLYTTGAPTSLAVTAPPGLYYVRVRAVNAYGVSVPSDEVVLLVL